MTLSKGSNGDPISQIILERITNLYDLMDSAYDAPQIHSFSEKLGHKPIIDHNPPRGEKIYMDPVTKARFAERSSAERVNSNLKDNYGGRNIRVKGAAKVIIHLMMLFQFLTNRFCSIIEIQSRVEFA